MSQGGYEALRDIHRHSERVSDKHRMDWTEERADFFRGMGHQMNVLIYRLHSIFGNPEAVLQLADSGIKALPEYTEEDDGDN